MASTFGSSGGSWGAGNRATDLRARRLRGLATSVVRGVNDKYDRTGGEISGDAQVGGKLDAVTDIVTQSRVLAKRMLVSHGETENATGVAFAAADEVAIVRDGVPRINMTADGRIGFDGSGTPHAPSCPFEFAVSANNAYDPAGDNRAGAALKLGNSEGFAMLFLQANGSQFTGAAQAWMACVATDSDARADLAFGTRGQSGATALEKMRITHDGRVAIGTTSPHESAQLEVASTTRGFLPPRMTAAEASVLVEKADGLVVYVTDAAGAFVKGWWGWTGTTWQQMG
jgi:hypothetical protein